MKFVSFLVSLSMIVSPLYGWGQARKAMSPYQNIADDFGNAKNIHDLLMNSQGKISEDSREILMNYAKAHNLVALPTVRALDDGVKVIMKDISATFRFPIDKPGFVYVNEELYRLPENSAQMQQLIKRIEMQFDKEYPEKTASLDFLLPRAHALFQIMFFILIAGVYTIEAVSTVATVATWVLGALAVYGIHKKMIDTNKAHYE
ncbi:MAG: hypothetical protein KDD61_17775, partial [Bdellovibrionales bacterium]|nr:hypothetical protein [Bdellovibrionales bacterium]